MKKPEKFPRLNNNKKLWAEAQTTRGAVFLRGQRMGYQGLFSARLYRLIITVLFISRPAPATTTSCLSSRAFRSRLPPLLRMNRELPYGTTPTWPPPAHADEVTPPGTLLSPQQLVDRFGQEAAAPSGSSIPVQVKPFTICSKTVTICNRQ